MVEQCALSGSDLKIKFTTILLTSIGFVFIAFVMYITTTMCDGVRHCLWFVFDVFLVFLHGD